jgi:hypothetical protein
MNKIYAAIGLAVNFVTIVAGGRALEWCTRYWSQFIENGAGFPDVSIYIMNHYYVTSFVFYGLVIIFVLLLICRASDSLFIHLANVTHFLSIAILLTILYAMAGLFQASIHHKP